VLGSAVRKVKVDLGCLIAPKGLCPKGQESIAQGLPWVFGFIEGVEKGLRASSSSPTTTIIDKPAGVDDLCYAQQRLSLK
jgi:hypothetical protein